MATQGIRPAVVARRDPDLLIMARTDIRGAEGLEAAVRRVVQLADAGADAIFPEAMADLTEFETIRAATNAPLLPNMTEFGISELCSEVMNS